MIVFTNHRMHFHTVVGAISYAHELLRGLQCAKIVLIIQWDKRERLWPGCYNPAIKQCQPVLAAWVIGQGQAKVEDRAFQITSAQRLPGKPGVVPLVSSVKAFIFIFWWRLISQAQRHPMYGIIALTRSRHQLLR